MKMEMIAPLGHRGGASGSGTQAVRAGNLILVGGQMSLDEQGRVIGSDIATQARNAFNTANGRLLTAPQWNTLKTSRMQPMATRYAAMLAEDDL